MASRLHELLRHWAEAKPDAPYLYYNDETITYAMADERSTRLARALHRAGVRPGNRVALMMANRPELVYCYFACFKLGAMAVPVNTRYTRREAQYVLTHSGAPVLIVSAEFFPAIQGLRRKGEIHDKTIIVDGDREGIDSWTDYEAFVSGQDEDIDWPEVPLDAPAVMLHTSGSTANPKGVVHTHRTLYHCARLASDAYDAPNLPVIAVYLSMLYILGLGFMLLRNTYAGNACALVAKREVGELLRTIRERRCSDLLLMPTDLIFILESPEAKELDWSCMKLIGAGGDKASIELHEKVFALTGVHPTECYGMTECSPITANPVYGRKVPGSMGVALDGVEIEIRNMDGSLVDEGGIGDLWVKSPACMVGYWNNPQATAETLVDGWLKTGDRARCDSDGYYWFEGRSKLIIVRHGSNIAPQEVEEVLDHHPAVLCSCVVGLPDPTWGERVCALIELRPGYTATAEEIIDYARHNIAAYKAPEEIIFLEHMPTNSSGKLDRAKMKSIADESAASPAI